MAAYFIFKIKYKREHITVLLCPMLLFFFFSFYIVDCSMLAHAEAPHFVMSIYNILFYRYIIIDSISFLLMDI